MRLLLFFVFVFGLTASQAYNTVYFDLVSGKTREIDVAYKGPLISLRVEVQSRNAFIEPKAYIENEFGGFECRLDRNILLFSGFGAQTRTWNQTWEIRVLWSPGSDYSGCVVGVTHPSLLDGTRARLYMSF
ncbi:MAG: hypothetical protein N2578_06995 [Bdellovibrionaceae bacterium]|nr:hypothetical protein [Pseudobdellovibrionaceae bacterium]